MENKNNEFTSLAEGWDYISAIFKMMTAQGRDNPFEQHFLYRGISKRYFSESPCLIKDLEIDNKAEPEKIKEEVQNYYNQIVYPYMRLGWEIINGINKEIDKYIEERLKDKESYDNSKFDKQDLIENFSKIKIPSDALSKLEILKTLKYYPQLIPEFIESGLAVRLQARPNKKTNNSVNKHIDYINYIIHMINDLKTKFPKYVDENYTDLEILADIQHKGAASCLVDFSDNFLTSLWFATNSDPKDFGYLFCYDINNDVLVKDRLTILDPQRYDEKRIIDLLYETTKTTMYSGKREYKFWLWRPSNVNERIARQDSVFLFGLEKFLISDHTITVVPIPPSWKTPIQFTLKTYFGITGESIYCDVDGYADSNSKTTPYEKTVYHYFKNIGEIILDNLQCGMDCLFQCEYELALKYFILFEKDFEGANKEVISKAEKDRIELELHYSKALCLKHMGDVYGAINEYTKLLKYEVSDEEFKKGDYYKKKYQKTINDLLDLYYDLKQYDEINTYLVELGNILETNVSELEKCIKEISYDKDLKSLLDKIKDEHNNVLISLLDKKEYKDEKEKLIFGIIFKLSDELELRKKELDKNGYKDKKENILKYHIIKQKCNFLALKITINNEIKCLKAIENYHKNRTNDNDQKKTNNTKMEIDGEYECLEISQPLYYLLNKYFKGILEFLINGTEEIFKNLEVEIKNKNDKLKDIDEYFYSWWQLKDIKRSINRLKDREKVVKLKLITSKMEDFANYCKGISNVDPY